MSYIVLAIPVFLLLIAIELLVTWAQEKDYDRLDDSLNDLGCGILDQLVEAFAKTALAAVALTSRARASGHPRFGPSRSR